jgi:hypothetical protein
MIFIGRPDWGKGGMIGTLKQRDLARAFGRQDPEPPAATAVAGWRYHHIGIPTQTPRPDERYLPRLKMYVSGFETSPYGIQWMRFDADSTYPEIVKTVPHVAFEVDDLAAALEGKEILIPPNSPGEGVTVAMIVDDGAPVELLAFQPSARRSKSTQYDRKRSSAASAGLSHAPDRSTP